jgi:2-polyprenyl-3-methyl-5-hydroxy-6-metoxy-1,4-benzoquinol methylase
VIPTGDVGALGCPDGPWFNEVAEFLGTAYLRNAFTKGTEQEVEFLVGQLVLEAGDRGLDVGCGPGRHSLALARRGIETHGYDMSPEFVDVERTDVLHREGRGNVLLLRGLLPEGDEVG